MSLGPEPKIDAIRLAAVGVRGEQADDLGPVEVGLSADVLQIRKLPVPLAKVVGQCQICPRKLAQQASHARLMPSNQFAESMLVFIDNNSSDEVRIG